MDLHHISDLLPNNQVEVAEGYPLVGQSVAERRNRWKVRDQRWYSLYWLVNDRNYRALVHTGIRRPRHQEFGYVESQSHHG